TTRFFDSIVPISKNAARWSPTVKNWRRCAASDSHSGENRNDENEPDASPPQPVRITACRLRCRAYEPRRGRTMEAQNITLSDLLPGFVVADKGGVVRIAELQSQGYVYLKP